MKLLLRAAADGVIGALGRYLVGSLLMGTLIALVTLRFSGSTGLRTYLAVGILGSFSTFFAFSLDFAVSRERSEHLAALLYPGASVAFSLPALLAGLGFARRALE